ncbi:MAG: tripartite tricarboxylate transporter TctB family protein [Burkholderiales bacterium]
MLKVNDVVSGGFVVAVGAVLLFATRSFPEIPGEPGPALFPRLAATVLMVCGALIALHALRHRLSEPWVEWPTWFRQPRQAFGVLFIVVVLAVSALAMEAIGFFPCAGVLVLGLLISLGVRIVIAMPVAIVSIAIVHLIFYSGLRVALPWGVLESFAW